LNGIKIALLAALVVLSSVVGARQQRSTTERHAFVKENACPATGRYRLPCAGYQIDHVVPLCAGGADHRSNMQWLSVEEHRAKTVREAGWCRK
jgi:5-methylcytosine-specific restriction endonuclease McrA